MTPDPPKQVDPEVPGMPRCLDCFYVLEGLTEPRCPECGRPFKLDDPATFTRKPPFLRWQFWLPGLGLALGVGFVIFLTLLPFTRHVAIGATIAAPFSVGTILGYRCRVRPIFQIGLAICAAIAMVCTLVALDISGLLCGVIAMFVILAPVLVGAAFGRLLRERLKRSNFSQRSYLPIILMASASIIWWLIEWRLDGPLEAESVSTAVVAPIDVHTAWSRMRFYEELPGGRPLAFRIGAPRPLYTTLGRDERGHLRTCVYDRGRVVKRLARVVPLRLLAFDIIEQQIHVEHDVRLIGGSFAFEPIDSQHTRITLTTEYQPLLRPRLCWRPFELWITHTLHEHILGGMNTPLATERRNAFAGGPIP